MGNGHDLEFFSSKDHTSQLQNYPSQLPRSDGKVYITSGMPNLGIASSLQPLAHAKPMEEFVESIEN